MDPSIVVVGDFNADGRSDIAGMHADVGGVLLLGNGDGSFQTLSVFSTGAQPFAVAVGDVDGDGINDSVVAGDGPEHGDLFLVRGAGAGAFQPPVRLSETANGIRGLAIGDVNGDGRPDVIAGNTLTDTVDVFVASATGAIPPASFLAATPGSIALADVNGDGHVDVITSSNSLSGVNVLPGNGDGTFEPFRNDGIPARTRNSWPPVNSTATVSPTSSCQATPSPRSLCLPAFQLTMSSSRRRRCPRLRPRPHH